MIYRVRFKKVSLLFLVILASVTLRTGGVMSADVEIDMDSVLHLIGRHTAGHACPVFEGFALTAAHVTDLRWMDKGFPLMPYRFSNEKGYQGIAQPMNVFANADIGWLRLMPSSVGYYEMSKRTPMPEDKVFWIEYESKKRKEFFGTRRREAKVLRVVAGHLFLDESPASGASGGCVFNERGEVIGIMTAGWRVGSSTDTNVGEAVGVYGDWRPVHPEGED